MYGLTKENISDCLDKIERNKDFLYGNYIEISGEKVPIASFFKNTYINADRYIAELQHRVWSLVEYAQNRDLVNIFLTLTNSPEYHPTKKLRNGKIVKNPKYAHRDKVLFDIFTQEKATSYDQMIFRHYKTLNRTVWTGKFREISLDPKDYSPKKGSKKLTEMFSVLRQDRSFKDIEKDDRVYFRVTEPHKSGTPHLHISLWIPKEYVARFVQAVHRFFPAPQADIASTYIPEDYSYYERVYKKDGKWFGAYKSTSDSKSYIKLQIDDSVSYLMKYIYKTLDDLRDDKGITEITLWYIHHGICRFYTSRTLMSLNIYRPLNGRFSLIELTQHFRDETVTVYLDTDSGQPRLIQYDDVLIWKKKDFELKQFDAKRSREERTSKTLNIRTVDIEIDGDEFYMFRGGSKLHKKYDDVSDNEINQSVPIASRMKAVQLWNYFHSLDIDDPSINIKHYGLVQNEMVRRGLINGVEIQKIGDFNTDFFDEGFRVF